MMQLGVTSIQICFHPKGKNLREKMHTAQKQHEDHFGGMTAAEKYCDDEATCDQHMETFIKCIKASGKSVKTTQCHNIDVLCSCHSLSAPDVFFNEYFHLSIYAYLVLHICTI